jgi:redox-sensitive bicupin YhaK (pirin superfamily)
MEIVSIVLSGELEHRDSMGTGSVIRRGEVQRMTAGTGVLHSEKNHSPSDEVHFFQIWIVPERRGLTPGYEQKAFDDAERKGKLRLVASRDGREGSVTVHQDVSLYSTLLSPGERVKHSIAPGRRAWVQVASGAVTVGGVALSAGDGAALEKETEIALEAVAAGDGGFAELIVFDLA